ncbi:general stress protein [Schumannella soli]|uniref:general stress protein n=1 Tax=Schumannella soli TaxID=2590779 RepID=UPI0015E835F7|nr:general stress protein [Schumannella soli]
MSTPGAFGRRGNTAPTLPRGEVLGTYETYLEAAHAVDRLAKSDFPVDKLSIIGNDLKTVERVTGRMTWGRAALGGAVTGLWFGFMVGLLLTVLGSTSLTPLFAAILIGAAGGMFFGLGSYAVSRRRKDFTSMTNVLASNYQVIVDPELIHRARNALGVEAPVSVAPTFAPDPATPPAAPPAEAPGTAGPVIPPVDPAPQAEPTPRG